MVLRLGVLLCGIFLLKYIFKEDNNVGISKYVKSLVLMFFLSILVSFVLRGQTLYEGVMAITQCLPLCFFFILKKLDVDIKTIKTFIISIAILYILIWMLSITTFPDNIFGYNISLLERADSDIENRGVVRLGIPGADFIILCIFIIMTTFSENRMKLIFLLPLVVMLLLRGTRTPFFITIFICAIYYVVHQKNKLKLLLLSVLLIFSMNYVYNTLLHSNSDNILVKYVKITDYQIKNNKDEDDIRFRMSGYYLEQFNDNIFQCIMGNGVPYGTSSYGKEIAQNGELQNYYMEDVGYVKIFVCFGVVGLVLYLLLLKKVVKTKADNSIVFAKMYVIYIYIVSFTGGYILTASTFPFVLSLYLLDKEKT